MKSKINLFAAALLCLTGCTGSPLEDPQSDSVDTPVVVSGRTVLRALGIENGVTVNATVEPVNATNKTLEWSVSSEEFIGIQVSEDTLSCLIYAKKGFEDNQSVTATTVDGGFTASVDVDMALPQIDIMAWLGQVEQNGNPYNYTTENVYVSGGTYQKRVYTIDANANVGLYWRILSYDQTLADVQGAIKNAPSLGESTSYSFWESPKLLTLVSGQNQTFNLFLFSKMAPFNYQDMKICIEVRPV